jgi:hypothetical protein
MPALRRAHDGASALWRTALPPLRLRRTRAAPVPEVQKVDLRPVGAGTERAEERLGILFPDYPVLRVDRDSTSRKDAMNQLFATIQKGQPCILVGTQMLAKGHHFPRVTLVSILDADGGCFPAISAPASAWRN